MLKVKEIRERLSLFLKNDKSKILIKHTSIAFMIKGLAIIVSFFTIPTYLIYFSDDIVLGVWFTLLALLSWILNFDLGVGNGLRNKLVESKSKGDVQLSKKLISSSYVSVTALSALIFIIGSLLILNLNWYSILNISSNKISQNNLNLSLLVLLFSVCTQFILKIINSVFYAYQKSFVNNSLLLFSNILILMYMLLANYLDIRGNLLSISLVRLIAINLPLLIATFYFFIFNEVNLIPKIKYYDNKIAQSVLVLGGLFFSIQIFYMLLSTTNEILITNLSGPEYVVKYQIYYRVYTLISTVSMLALTPLWSLITKAKAENDFKWIQSIYRSSLYISLGVTVIQFSVILIGQNIFDIWLGENEFISQTFTSLLFATVGSLMIWTTVFSSFANGLGYLKPQFITFLIAVLLKVPLSIYLVDKFNSWEGVVMAQIIVSSFYVIVQPIFLNKTIKYERGSE